MAKKKEKVVDSGLDTIKSMVHQHSEFFDTMEEADHKKAKTDSVTYEELRQRLHRKIDELKGSRGGSDRPRSHEKRKKIVPNKRKREKTVEEEDKAKLDVEEAAKDLTFSYFKIDDDEEHGKGTKKRRLSKSRELERALKLEAAKKDPEKGEVIAKKHSWQAATSRAAGIKVHDDPKLLKQSIHKEKKRQEKNAEKWKERVEGQQKVRVEKQQKRSGNIAERIEQNKMRKIAKREKKLLRPGFEGRKEGFVNDGKVCSLKNIPNAMSQMITNPSLRAHQTMVTIKAITQNKLSLSAAEGKCFAAARCVASGSGYATVVEPVTPEEEKRDMRWRSKRRNMGTLGMP
ncbi:hypothetical protein F2Q69_00018426 [Brassica cretica]|uniref:Ribosomal RNA-processing protein 14/surfeit locus protein 6 C-terminal domain-containing protein n=1 Tax=Brassica cretica TaxID=69181 RepID=A0A8S9QDA6_BRACR|nr:hypothetical protein F2Q69_00018426 [Brassica cretica]